MCGDVQLGSSLSLAFQDWGFLLRNAAKVRQAQENEDKLAAIELSFPYDRLRLSATFSHAASTPASASAASAASAAASPDAAHTAGHAPSRTLTKRRTAPALLKSIARVRRYLSLTPNSSRFAD